MKYLLPLVILINCLMIQGVLEWTVVGKITEYGQNVTLFCNVPNCCPKDAGWDRWTPHQRTLFIDVKTGRPNKKYDGKVLKDGYTLIIQNFTENDMNVSYSCLYGVTLGEIKFLLKEDVFTTSTQQDVPTGLSPGEIGAIITGITMVLVLVSIFIYFRTIRSKKQEKEENSELKEKLNKTETELSEIIPNNIRELIKKQIEDWEKKDKMFVSTKASDYVSYAHQDSVTSGVHESIPRQTSSASEAPRDLADVLDVPVDNDTPILDGWPSSETYSLNMIKKGKKQLDDNFLSARTYDTNPGKQCRVLCILNKQSRDKALYHGNGMDVECTWLQQMKKQFKWDLQIHKDKTSAEICDILDIEMTRDFSVNHSLFVIIISRGDQYGIYGTHGERIEYWAITTRFDQVPGLKGKPKIFILDDCEIGSDIHDEVYSRGVQETAFTSPKLPIRTPSVREVLVDQRDSVAISNENLDTYICKASTMGRCDSVVKGSWVIGALMSVMCKAANNMTFIQIMRQVQLMIQDAIIPEGKPNPDMTITNDLTKDFYLLPPPC